VQLVIEDSNFVCVMYPGGCLKPLETWFVTSHFSWRRRLTHARGKHMSVVYLVI
jgi:hypothetical protein